jgi:nucleoside-diphosphate-sugar epimerase
MKILLVGATGFIGKHIEEGLREVGYDVTASSRGFIDFSTLQLDNKLVNSLQNFDIVVNAVGIIAESKSQTFEQMHTLAPIALFDACKKAGVRRVIHISALGSQSGTTAYHTSKNRADVYLRESGLSYAILHPSVVYGDDGKSTALFQALATLPLTPLVGDGSQILQPISIEDVVATVVKAINSSNEKIELNMVGAKPVSYRELLETFRKWLGYRSTKSVSVPTFGTDVIGKVLGEPTVNHDNIIMLNQGNSADVQPLADFLGYTPIGFKENFEQKEAHHAQKLYASLYLIRPLLRLIIGFVWIWSGVVSAFLYPQAQALELLHEIGIPEGLDIYMLYTASFLDIALGVLTIMGCCLRGLLSLQMVVIVVYTLLLTLLAPYHWLHPFGPVLKNIPLVVTIYILMQMERFR